MQKALDTAKTITLPVPKDQLIINIDTFCQAIGATMFIRRGKTKLNSEFFGAKLSKAQLNWRLCEIEALTMKCALKHFSPFIQESGCETKVFTGSKLYVELVNKLKRVEFSLTSWLSKFLRSFNRI